MRQACGGVTQTVAYQGARQATTAALTVTGIWDEKSAANVKDDLHDSRYPDYVLGMLVFALTVVAYTTYGGFWAVTWTDVLQGLMIVVGAVLLMFLALHKVGGLENATNKLREISFEKPEFTLLTGPGPDNYLGPGLAVSFFMLWTLGSMGQPVGMVRLMACRDTPTLRRAGFQHWGFFALIYLPLVIAFVCARALYPTEYLGQWDRIMPAMALRMTEHVPLLGGL